MVEGELQPAPGVRRTRRLSGGAGGPGVRSRLAGSLILLAFGAVAMQVLLARGVTNADAADVVTAVATAGFGLAALANRWAAIPAALWGGGAAGLAGIQLIPPYEPRIGDLTFYLGYGLTGRHWDAAGGYLLTALAYGAAALLLLWSMGDSRPDAATASLPSRTAGSLLALAALFHVPSAFLLGMLVLGSPYGFDAFDATGVWLGGLGSVVVAWWARHGRRRCRGGLVGADVRWELPVDHRRNRHGPLAGDILPNCTAGRAARFGPIRFAWHPRRFAGWAMDDRGSVAVRLPSRDRRPHRGDAVRFFTSGNRLNPPVSDLQ